MAYLKNRTFSIYVKGFYKTFEIKIVNNVEQYVISTKQKTFSYDNCWWRWFKFVELVFWKFRTMYVIVWKWLWIFPYVRRKACVGYVCLRHLGEGWEQAFNTFHRFIETAQICTKVLVLGHLDMITILTILGIYISFIALHWYCTDPNSVSWYRLLLSQSQLK